MSCNLSDVSFAILQAQHLFRSHLRAPRGNLEQATRRHMGVHHDDTELGFACGAERDPASGRLGRITP